MSTRTLEAIDEFNWTYSTMLAKLEMAFRGDHDEMKDAIPMMLDLKYRAEQIVRVPLGRDGLHAHPTFEVDCDAFRAEILRKEST